MAVLTVTHFATVVMLRLLAAWACMRLAVRLAAAASVVVVAAAVYLGTLVSVHVNALAMQKAAADTALYMDSFVASHVQELAASDTLSGENRAKLERLLSPASMHRPVVAFRIWKGDTVVFSNERELIGKIFPRSNARQRALEGQIGVEFELADGDDDVQIRALNLPILEVYAPVREKGTGRIIAIAETYEIAIGLGKEVWISQLATWCAVSAMAGALILLLFSMAGTDRIERESFLSKISELYRLREEGEQRRRKIAHANMTMTQVNEQSLSRVQTKLQQGPLQNVTLALLKLDPAQWANSCAIPTAADKAKSVEEIECVREALIETLRQMRDVYAIAVPPNIAELTPGEALASAAREHHRRSGVVVEYDVTNAPTQLPIPLKACLYRIALEGLCGTATGARSQLIRATQAGTSLAIEIVGGSGGEPTQGRLATLRSRIEALGGTLAVSSTPAGQLLLTAEIDLAEMGLSVG